MHSDAIADLEMTVILQNAHLYPLGRKEFPQRRISDGRT